VTEQTTFAHWVILELMGHRRLAGWLTEEEIGGATFLRLDIPDEASQFYSPSAVYCITPTTEEIARRVAAGANPAPVQRWELPPAPSSDRDEDPDIDRDWNKPDDVEDL
jgi:hypothetical protein